MTLNSFLTSQPRAEHITEEDSELSIQFDDSLAAHKLSVQPALICPIYQRYNGLRGSHGSLDFHKIISRQASYRPSEAQKSLEQHQTLAMLWLTFSPSCKTGVSIHYVRPDPSKLTDLV